MKLLFSMVVFLSLPALGSDSQIRVCDTAFGAVTLTQSSGDAAAEECYEQLKSSVSDSQQEDLILECVNQVVPGC